MPEIVFAKAHRPPFYVAAGTNLMKALLNNGSPVASSCHGDGVCGKCRIQIVQGGENLTSENDTEKFLREKLSIPLDQRVSCQTQVLGDIVVATGYW